MLSGFPCVIHVGLLHSSTVCLVQFYISAPTQMWKHHLPMSAASGAGFKAWHGRKGALTTWSESWDWRHHVAPVRISTHIYICACVTMDTDDKYTKLFDLTEESSGIATGLHASSPRHHHPRASPTVSAPSSSIADIKVVRFSIQGVTNPFCSVSGKQSCMAWSSSQSACQSLKPQGLY